MSQRNQSFWFRTGYGVAAAVLLAACGQFSIVGLSFLAWCVLRPTRPAAPVLVVTAASIFAAITVLTIVDLVAGRISTPALVEILAAAAAAFLLLFRGANFWVYLLIAHSVFVIAAAVLNLQHPDWPRVPEKALFGAIVVNIFLILLFVEHLRTTRSSASAAPPPVKENG